MLSASRIGAEPIPWGGGAVAIAKPLEIDVDEIMHEIDATLDEGIVVQAVTGEVIWHNSAICRLLGTCAEQLPEALDRIASHAIGVDDRPIPPESSPATATLRTHLPVRNRTIGVESGDGGPLWISISSQPGTRAGEFVAITSFRDITLEENSRRELEGALRQVHAFLTQASLPTGDRVDFAAAHRRAPRGSTRGHDFFGAHELAPDRYCFYVGTVAGRATRSACVGSLARDTLRSAGMLLDQPDDVMQHLDDTVRAEWPDTTLSSLFGYVDVADDVARVRLTCAGRPLPLVLANDRLQPVDIGGPMVGATNDARRRALELELHAGSRLVVASDGLVDRWGAAEERADVVQPLRGVTGVDELADMACALAPADVAPYPDADLTAIVVGVA